MIEAISKLPKWGILATGAVAWLALVGLWVFVLVGPVVAAIGAGGIAVGAVYGIAVGWLVGRVFAYAYYRRLDRDCEAAYARIEEYSKR